MPKAPKLKNYGYAVKEYGTWNEGGFLSVSQPVRAKNPEQAKAKITKHIQIVTDKVPPIKILDWAKVKAKQVKKDNRLFEYPTEDDTETSDSELREKINEREGGMVAEQFDDISSGQSIDRQNANALFEIEHLIRKDRPSLAYDIRKYLLKYGFTKKEILKGYHKDRGMGL